MTREAFARKHMSNVADRRPSAAEAAERGRAAMRAVPTSQYLSLAPRR
jgi:hypothetical protein